MKASSLVIGFVALALGACGADGPGDGGSNGQSGAGADAGSGGSSGSASAGAAGDPSTGGTSGGAGAGGSSNGGGGGCSPVGTASETLESATFISEPAPDGFVTEFYWDNLALDRTHVYWAEWSDGTDMDLYRMPRDGGTKALVTTYPAVLREMDLVVDKDGFVYTSTMDDVFRAPASGGAAEKLWAFPPYGGVTGDESIQTDSTTIYVLDEGNVVRVGGVHAILKADLAVTKLADFEYPYQIAIDDQNVYVAVHGIDPVDIDLTPGYHPSLYRLPKAGGAPVLLAEFPRAMDGLQVTATHVYARMIEAEPLYSLVRVPIGGGPLENLGGTGCFSGKYLKISEGYLYFLDNQGLLRMKADGTEVTKFAGGPLTGHVLGEYFLENQFEVDQGVVYELDLKGKIARHAIH